PEPQRVRDVATSYFAGRGARRVYIQVDKPLYKPGETIWIRTFDLQARDLGAHPQSGALHYQPISPKGATVLRKLVREEGGFATNDFVLPEGVQGGEYLVRVWMGGVTLAERPVIVSTYEPPRIHKKLEFVRKGYGAGDEVAATISVKR